MKRLQNKKRKKNRRSQKATWLTEGATWTRLRNDVFQNIKTRSKEPQKDNGADQESKLKGRESIIFQCDKYKKVKKVFWWDGCKIKMDTPFEIFNHSNWLQYLPMDFIFNALFIVNEIHTRMKYYLENI